MSSEFEWLKQLPKLPKYTEIVSWYHDESSFTGDRARSRGFLITEGRIE